LAELKSFGLPILIGLSRKRFINVVSPSGPQERIGGSIAGNVMAVLEGADIVRVHDVAETVQAMRVLNAVRKARHG
jgi:dihydropteroate synthase